MKNRARTQMRLFSASRRPPLATVGRLKTVPQPEVFMSAWRETKLAPTTRALARRFSGKIKFASARGTRKNALARSPRGSRADTGRREGEKNRAAEIEPSTKPAAGFGDERLRTSPAALD